MTDILMNEIIDFILIDLKNDEDNKIEFYILKLRAEESLKIRIDDSQKKSIMEFVLLHDLCNRTFTFNGKESLELTNKGRNVISKGIEKFLIDEEKNKQLDIDSKVASIENLHLAKKSFPWIKAGVFLTIITIGFLVVDYIQSNKKIDNNQNDKHLSPNKILPKETDSVPFGSSIIEVISDSINHKYNSDK